MSAWEKVLATARYRDYTKHPEQPSPQHIQQLLALVCRHPKSIDSDQIHHRKKFHLVSEAWKPSSNAATLLNRKVRVVINIMYSPSSRRRTFNYRISCWAIDEALSRIFWGLLLFLYTPPVGPDETHDSGPSSGQAHQEPTKRKMNPIVTFSNIHV